MQTDLFGALVPALIMFAAVILLEEWAFFKARTKWHRALITAVAVFLIVLLLNLPWGS